MDQAITTLSNAKRIKICATSAGISLVGIVAIVLLPIIGVFAAPFLVYKYVNTTLHNHKKSILIAIFAGIGAFVSTFVAAMSLFPIAGFWISPLSNSILQILSLGTSHIFGGIVFIPVATFSAAWVGLAFALRDIQSSDYKALSTVFWLVSVILCIAIIWDTSIFIFYSGKVIHQLIQQTT